MSINCGIYVMYFEQDDGQYYVGKSGNTQERHNEHCRKLKYGTHANKKMQQLFNKYLTFPIMEPLEEVIDLNKQQEREIFWIKHLDTYHSGLNGTIGGDDIGFGANTPTQLYTEEVYENILKELANTDKQLKDIQTELGVQYQVVRKISSESEHAWLIEKYPELTAIVKDKCGKRKGYKNTADVYENILYLRAYTELSVSEIALECGVKEQVVKNIIYGKQHLYLQDKLPEVWALVIGKSGKVKKGPKNTAEYPKVKDPYGNIHQVGPSCRSFALANNLIPTNLHKVCRGIALSHKGWTLA